LSDVIDWESGRFAEKEQLGLSVMSGHGQADYHRVA